MIGCGNETMDETQNGLIVLDELASWLNSRTFNDKSRMPVLDWLIHSRKKGWDVMFICQHIDQIDKQVRTALVEYLVTCRRLDRMRIPLVGGAIKALSGGWVSGNLPKIHLAVVRYGVQPDAIKADTWMYQGKDLYGGYDTRQIFSDSYSSGTMSYLPPWYLVGYQHKTLLEKLAEWWCKASAKPALRPKHPLAVRLAQLPPDDAVRHWRRLDELGYWDKCAQ